jgi:hypothetical protein
MDTPETPGKALNSDDPEARREAGRLMGSARTERKIAAARAVAESRRGVKWTEEQKARLRAAQQARRERERRERLESDQTMPVKEKRPVGRPRTRPTLDEDTPKRPVGRPKKPQEAPDV